MPATYEICVIAPVIPVLIIDDLNHAVPLAKALVKGGLPVLEVTLRTPVALDAIRMMVDAVPDAIVGAGTLLSAEDVSGVVATGARFGVSPGSTPHLIDAALDAGLPLLPGVATASEVMTVLDRGITTMKFFPAEQAGGRAMLKAWSSPLAAVSFCPTGGISPTNAADYLALPNVVCVGGSWVAPKDAVQAGDWDRIEELAREATALRKSD